MDIEVKLKPLPDYKGVGFLAMGLFQSGILPEKYSVKKLEDGIYMISIKDAPDNWEQILGKFGNML